MFLSLSIPSHNSEIFVAGEAGVMVFAAPIKGKVLQLLSHHIIYGEIVVPGRLQQLKIQCLASDKRSFFVAHLGNLSFLCRCHQEAILTSWIWVPEI